MKYRSFGDFIKQEMVLCIAVLLAVISCFFVPPDKGYADYIDYRTLALLFSLMTVMAGFQKQGVFYKLGRLLLSRAGGIRQILLVLVLLCFFGSMIITNDVALITFVPFAFVVLELLGAEERRKLILPLVCMQTLAANLGSMFTPIGNPQNLYLYGKSGLDMPGFLRLMLPYTAASLFLLLLWIFLLCRGRSRTEKTHVALESRDDFENSRKKVGFYCFLFVLCLLTVIRVLPYPLLFGVVIVSILCLDRKTLTAIDYSLLLTFVGFFVFIGNLGRISAFSQWLGSVLEGREVPVAVLTSQVISNLPAALLLSGFSDRTAELIVGVNLGGLGTLIASMASLISFRFLVKEEPKRKGEYFLLFTVSGVLFLFLLLGLWFLISGG